MADKEFIVTAELATKWAQDYRAAVDRNPGDTEENRRHIFIAWLLLSFADTLNEAVEESAEEEVRADPKALN